MNSQVFVTLISLLGKQNKANRIVSLTRPQLLENLIPMLLSLDSTHIFYLIKSYFLNFFFFGVCEVRHFKMVNFEASVVKRIIKKLQKSFKLKVIFLVFLQASEMVSTKVLLRNPR